MYAIVLCFKSHKFVRIHMHVAFLLGVWLYFWYEHDLWLLFVGCGFFLVRTRRVVFVVGVVTFLGPKTTCGFVLGTVALFGPKTTCGFLFGGGETKTRPFF